MQITSITTKLLTDKFNFSPEELFASPFVKLRGYIVRFLVNQRNDDYGMCVILYSRNARVNCRGNVLKVPIFIFAEGLKNDCDHCHEGLHHTKLESCLRKQKRKL